MNQFLIDGILCRAVYCDNPHGFGEEIGGCWNFAYREVTECQDCEHRQDCPADGDDCE